MRFSLRISGERTFLNSPALGIALALAAILPLLLRGPSCGHDFDFHLQSWFAVRAAWHAGLLVPHWIASANYGAGEPRFVFYPPLSWLLGAALGLVLPWKWVPAAFTAVCFAGAAAGMHRLASRFCRPGPAALAGVLYAASPYLLFTAYERAAYGELLAAAWMPPLLAAVLAPRLPVVRTASLLAALWYTNAPAGVMGCYLVLLSFFWKAGRELARRKSTLPTRSHLRMPKNLRAISTALVRYGGALLLGCALAADYLLPAWYEQRFIAIQRAVGPGMRIEDSFLFAHTGEPFHDGVLGTASWIAALTLGAGATAAAALLWSRRTERAATSRSRTVSLDGEGGVGFPALLIGICFLLQLRPSSVLWHALPELAFLQFPWRLLLPASAAATLLVVLALPARGEHRQFAWVGIALFYVAGMTVWAGQTRYQPCDEQDNVPAQLALLGSGAGFEGTDEYAAIGSDNGEIQQGLPAIRLLHGPDADEGDDSLTPNPSWKPPPEITGSVQVKAWNPEKLSIRIRPEVGVYAVLRLERFPGWQVLLDGKPCGAACVTREDGLLAVRVPPMRTSTIDVQYRATADVRWGRAVSGAALLLLLANSARRRFPSAIMRRK